MALRSSWKGFLRLSLVSVPVKAYSALITGEGEIHLNQLHSTCHSRIRYVKTCPLHGEVPHEEIVTGYEYAKDQYVVISPTELAAARTKAEKAINIDRFIASDAIDPILYGARSYFLLPDGPVGQKPYLLLYEAMEREKRVALARVVMTTRDDLVAIRAANNLLSMSVLYFDHQLKKPSAFLDEVPKTTVSDEELRLARTLIKETSSDEVDWSSYRDQYVDKLTQVIESKVAGQEVVAPPQEEEVQVVNLMDALRKSLKRTQSEAAPRGTAASGRRAAKPATTRKAAKKRRAS